MYRPLLKCKLPYSCTIILAKGGLLIISMRVNKLPMCCWEKCIRSCPACGGGFCMLRELKEYYDTYKHIYTYIYIYVYTIWIYQKSICITSYTSRCNFFAAPCSTFISFSSWVMIRMAATLNGLFWYICLLNTSIVCWFRPYLAIMQFKYTTSPNRQSEN